MKWLALALLCAACPAVVAAQASPTPGFEDPRLQTISFDPSRPVRLVAFPSSSLTVILLPDDPIQRAVLSEPAAFEVRVTGANDSLSILPLRPDAVGTLLVDTAQRRYEFEVETGQDLAAAYVVRFVPNGYQPQPQRVQAAVADAPIEMVGAYRLSGEANLLPSHIGDDGDRTYIEWAEHQSLPAVFGIGTNGEEEVVDGYMRNDVFTIDRVYGELVFRIDKKRARARRLESRG